MVGEAVRDRLSIALSRHCFRVAMFERKNIGRGILKKNIEIQKTSKKAVLNDRVGCCLWGPTALWNLEHSQQKNRGGRLLKTGLRA